VADLVSAGTWDFFVFIEKDMQITDESQNCYHQRPSHTDKKYPFQNESKIMEKHKPHLLDPPYGSAA
jgi:hypothetical protein